MGSERESHAWNGPDAISLSAATVRDPLLQRALMVLVRFRAWLLGSVCTAGSLAVVTREDGAALPDLQPEALEALSRVFGR